MFKRAFVLLNWSQFWAPKPVLCVPPLHIRKFSVSRLLNKKYIIDNDDEEDEQEQEIIHDR